MLNVYFFSSANERYEGKSERFRSELEAKVSNYSVVQSQIYHADLLCKEEGRRGGEREEEWDPEEERPQQPRQPLYIQQIGNVRRKY